MRTRRKVWKAPIAIAIAAGISLVAGCRQPAGDEAVEKNEAKPVLPLPPLPVAEAPMDRAAILLAVARAASAAALGQSDDRHQRDLDGKRFEVRLRFGCNPAARTKEDGGRFGVSFNEKDRTLRLRASPDLGIEDEPVAALAAKGVEAVEGFWIERPWLLTDGCPATPQPQPPPQPGAEASKAEKPEAAAPFQPPGPRIGVAQFFTKTDPRTGRRDHRPYEATSTLGAGERPSAEGYNLVLSGRLRAQPLGRVISCHATGVDAPPKCIVSADFDRVWIENPRSKEILANWGS
jgi:hypothetical protein